MLKEKIKNMLKNNNRFMNAYLKWKQKKQNKIKFNTKYNFINRSTGKNKICYILAGYKEFLWDEIFNRIKKYVPNDVDVCILSSGKYSEYLDKIATQNNWSYLSTKRNNVCIAQNILFREFKNCEYFYKLDEDIFITEHFFEGLDRTYNLEKDGEYKIAFVSPLLPINGFAYVEILKRFNLTDIYADKFENAKHVAMNNIMIDSSPEVAKFMWGSTGEVPKLDKMADVLWKDAISNTICPIRFSIGAIMFTRETINALNYFKASKSGCDLGYDEEQLCELAISKCMINIVSKNVVVGHLSFGKQNSVMKDYYLNHHDDMFNTAEKDVTE